MPSHEIIAPAANYTSTYRSMACTITGIQGDDTLTGTSGPDLIRDGSNDTWTGGAHADELSGEEDDVTVDSRHDQNGNDSLDGGPHVK